MTDYKARVSIALLLSISLCVAACSSNPDNAVLDPLGAAQPGSDLESGPQNSSDTNVNTPITPEQPHQDPLELARTWRAAMVSVPDGLGGVVETTTSALESGAMQIEGLYPVVIWMHGCNGFWSGTSYRLNWLARNGFVAVAPLSLARSFYPRSCNLDTFESGLYRPTLTMRQYDAGYAIQQVRKFSWADQGNLFLAGLSEGGAVATTYASQTEPGANLKARIAEAWGCHAGWREYEGINASPDEAVLTLLADRDPWYTADFHQGDCGEFMSQENGSLSFVVDYAPTRYMHELWEQPEIQEIILDFLLRQLLVD